MKIRNGFVSNSSSSSFVLITTEKTFKTVLNRFSKKEKKFIEETLYEYENITLNNSKYIVFSSDYHTCTLADRYNELIDKDCEGEEESIRLLVKFFDSFKGLKDSYSGFKDF